jgi:hypothetical protein
MSTFRRYRRKQISELRSHEPGENFDGVTISVEDKRQGSPKFGDMIARDPKNHADQWLASANILPTISSLSNGNGAHLFPLM